MDGYAVLDADLATLPARLDVVGTSLPGRAFPAQVLQGQAVRIFTGAGVPAGADRIVIQEEVRRDGEVAIFATVPGSTRYIRRKGSDFARGATIVPAGCRLDPRALVAAAAADLSEVSVFRRPRVALIASGDELVDPGLARSDAGKIPDSISLGVAAMAESWGAALAHCLRVADDLALLERAASECLNAADVVVVTGGASVGERDFAKAMFAASGLETLFSTVAIKPGKPVWLGRAGGRLVLGLPGNPTSALVTARLFLAPLLLGLGGGRPADAVRWRPASLVEGLEQCAARETFVRASVEGSKVRALLDQDSGAQRMLVDADAVIRRRAHAPGAAAGDEVEIIDF
jgi:molybdopterin molybdotransferase